MTPLHTPQELVQLSNAAHVAEGIVLAIIGIIVIAQGLGFLKKTWKRYLVPVIALLASLILAGFLFVDHYNELPAAWHWVTTDMQQQQHLLIGIILGFTSIAALIGLKLKQKWLELALPVAFVAIGVVFLIHPQHGTNSEAARALLIHRIAGTSLIIAGLAGTGAPLYKQWRKILSIVAGILLIVSAGLFISYREPLRAGSMSGMDMGSSKTIQSHHTYSLNLMQDMTYQPNQPTELMFDIRDENNKVLKDFDTVHTKTIHLIVVRKDRTNFQHVHPTFNKASGMFTLTGFQFPTDGQYRLFAEFTPSNAQTDDMGMRLTSVPFKDVAVGSGNYVPQPLGVDAMTSSADGLDTTLSLINGDNPTVAPVIYAGVPQTLGVTITKNGAPFNNLQPYLDSLGHLVILGPNLEYIHAHTLSDVTAKQNGLIMFAGNFPVAGQYKLYLQTQAEGRVNTTDYTLTAMTFPGSNSNSNNSMQNMGH